jgi:hypothetical protein
VDRRVSRVSKVNRVRRVAPDPVVMVPIALDVSPMIVSRVPLCKSGCREHDTRLH